MPLTSKSRLLWNRMASKSVQAFRRLLTRREHEVNLTISYRNIEACVCTVYIVMYLCTICYRYLKCTFLDEKSCT